MLISAFMVGIAACAAHTSNAQTAQAVRVADSTHKRADTARKVIPVPARPMPKAQRPKMPKAIKHEFDLGFRLNTDGWSAYTEYANVNNKDARHPDLFYNVSFFELEFTEKKDPHEEKITSAPPDPSVSPSRYVYGKINNFYALKLGWGFRKMIAGKPDPGCASIHWVNTGGLALGLQKPYYLDVSGDPNAIKYQETTASDFLNQQKILGYAGFSKGIGEMKFVPGGFLKTALHFDFSANRHAAVAMDVGLNFEYYSAGIPLMVNQKATPYFFGAFLGLQLGKRW